MTDKPKCDRCGDMGAVEFPEFLPCPRCLPDEYRAEVIACGLDPHWLAEEFMSDCPSTGGTHGWVLDKVTTDTEGRMTYHYSCACTATQTVQGAAVPEQKGSGEQPW